MIQARKRKITLPLALRRHYTPKKNFGLVNQVMKMRILCLESSCICILMLIINTTMCTPDTNGKGVCTRPVTFTEQYETSCQTSYRSSYTTWCWHLLSLFRCTEYRTRYKMSPCTRTRKASRDEFICCSGYKETPDSKCEPVCNPECINGVCIKPNTCLCDPGWHAINCSQVCLEGYWGQDCNNTCKCVNGGKCDFVNGTCDCPPGYIGENCEEECPGESYGLHCKETCQCQNDAECNHINGSCLCSPGYRGKYCGEPCLEGSYGSQCRNSCQCQNGATCDPRDGSCQCRPGWKGNLCDEPCPYGYYGSGCQHMCHCQGNGSCDPITGKCSCPPGFVGDRCQEECHCIHSMSCGYVDGHCVCEPGWTGRRCTSTCANGYYGHGCVSKCQCEHGYCDPVTGECRCNPGYDGKTCDKTCQKGMFGLGCKQTCICNKLTSVDCNPVDGRCVCQEGWHGLYCNSRCPEGYWGQTCDKRCECQHDGSCDAETGACQCSPGWTGEQCSEACPINTYGIACLQTCHDCVENNLTCSSQSGICVCDSDTFGNICQYEKKPKGLPMATIAGAASASILVISGIVGLIIYCIRKKNSGDAHKKQNSTDLTSLGYAYPDNKGTEQSQAQLESNININNVIDNKIYLVLYTDNLRSEENEADKTYAELHVNDEVIRAEQTGDKAIAVADKSKRNTLYPSDEELHN